jgi:acetylornithine aminotransferase
MKLFDVYPLFDIEPAKALGSKLWDKDGVEYLDLYGGHAVISIGHSHPHYVKKITEQINNIGFYSNSVQIKAQHELADKLGEMSGCDDYQLFLCSSGAEANENALKLASFHNGKKKIISFTKGFHGRTSLAVAATDNKNIWAPVNLTDNIEILPFNDEAALEAAMNEEVCAVIVEGIQGLGGVEIPTESFLKKIKALCEKNNALLILDEVQSGYGRSGKFFAFQYTDVKPDIISVAKGMGNGFPIGGILVSPDIKAKHGMLGTTFGGSYLACAAGIAVLDVMKSENLLENSTKMGDYLMDAVKDIEGVKEVRGLGLMVGIELEGPCAEVRGKIIKEHKIFTGSSSNKNVLRILPALNVTKDEIDQFVTAFKAVMLK